MDTTIAAIATAVGTSAINIIKISGKESIKIVNKIFKEKDLEIVQTYTIHYGHIYDNNQKIDEVLVSVFRAPKTYTGEDVVEINCHGGIMSANKIMELLLSNGCNLAEPGEFIKRAFLNGKKDLIEAESISDIINSETEKSLKMGIQGLTGKLTNLIDNLRNEILDIIANIEVNIDYPEYEDAIDYTNELLINKINIIKIELKKIFNESKTGKIIKNGINVGIIGKPNVGKSSLLNALLEENKAIVSNIEGTTRDLIEGRIILNGIILNLIDTAGIRETSNEIEKIGVEKSQEIINKSDLIIFILDGSKKITQEDLNIIKKIKNKKVITLVNKNDLNVIIDKSKLRNLDVIYCSIINNEGIEELKTKIIELFNLKQIETSDYTYLSNARQISLIKKSLNIINDIELANKKNISIDLIQIDLNNLWETLGEIIGKTYKEELINQIFSKFCLGK